jgi:hypothetical protein
VLDGTVYILRRSSIDPEVTGAVYEFQDKGERRKAAAKEEWKRNKRKNNRQSGKVYTSAMNLEDLARRVKEDCSKCTRKYTTNFSEHDRQSIHKAYQALWNTELNRQCLRYLVEEFRKEKKVRARQITHEGKTVNVFSIKRK